MRRFVVASVVAALVSPAFAQVVDGFEAYPDGPLSGQGGWTIWYSGGADGTVVSGGAHAGAKSMEMNPGTDAVQQPAIDGGQWDLSVWTFVPAESLDGYFIMMNQYGGPDNWSMQVRFNGDSTDPLGNVVESQFDGATLPVIVDTWVEFRAEIDLDADVVNTFYNGTPLGVALTWSGNVSGGGLPQIRCIDLYSATTTGFRWDDLNLSAAGGGCDCDGDMDGSGAVDITDLALFLSSFGSSPPAPSACADIDGSGAVDITDLALFLSAFGSTCP